jgi:hypothetical protein
VERRSIQVLKPWSVFVLYSLTTLNGEEYYTGDAPEEEWPEGVKQEFWVKGLGFDVKVHELVKESDPRPTPPTGSSYGPPIAYPSEPGYEDDNCLYVVVRPEHDFIPLGGQWLFAYFDSAQAMFDHAVSIGISPDAILQHVGIAGYGLHVSRAEYRNFDGSIPANDTRTRVGVTRIATRRTVDHRTVDVPLIHYPGQQVAPLCTDVRLEYKIVYDNQPCSLEFQFYRMFGRFREGFQLEFFVGPPTGIAGSYSNGFTTPVNRTQWYYPAYNSTTGQLTCAVGSGKYTDPNLPPEAPENAPPTPPIGINNEAYISASPDQVFALVKWGESEEEGSTDYAELIYKGLDIAGALTNLGQSGHVDDWRKDAVDLAPTASIEIEGSNPCLRDFLPSTNVTLSEGNLYTLDLNQSIGVGGVAQPLKTLLESDPGESGPEQLTVDTTIVHARPDNNNSSVCKIGTGTPLPCRIPVPGRGTVLGVAVMPT